MLSRRSDPEKAYAAVQEVRSMAGSDLVTRLAASIGTLIAALVLALRGG